MLGNRLGLDGAPGLYTSVERLKGYRLALDKERIAYDPDLVRHSLDSGAATALPEPPTAIFTSHNVITVNAVRAMREAGVHRTVALVGFDDIEMAEHCDPAITVVSQDPRRIGQTAAELLLARIAGDHSPARHAVVPTRLIARGSGELSPPGAR
jgi:LacI family transcriptional regulator